MQADRMHRFRSGSMNERAKSFFEQINIAGNTNKSHRCVVENCGNLIAGWKPSNMVSHLKCCHPEIYQNEVQNRNNKQSPTYYATKRLRFIQNCVEIVTVNCRPFRSLLDSGFKKLVQEQLNELEDGNCGIHLHSEELPEIKAYIKSV